MPNMQGHGQLLGLEQPLKLGLLTIFNRAITIIALREIERPKLAAAQQALEFSAFLRQPGRVFAHLRAIVRHSSPY